MLPSTGRREQLHANAGKIQEKPYQAQTAFN